MSLFETGVIPVVNDFLLMEAAKVRDYGEYWSASSAGYCMRKVIFDRLGVPPVAEDARKQRVFTSGHLFHSWIQELTKKAGISVAQEVELQDEELMIRGHFDDLILVGDNLILYDYKTQNSQAFTWAKKQDRGMSHYHSMQLGTYLHMLRSKDTVWSNLDSMAMSIEEILKKQVKESRVAKISKDDLRMAEEQLLWTPELEKKVYEYWSTLNGYWKAQKLPRCTCADYEVNQKTGKGFMADPRYNPYFYEDEPCSLKWYELAKKEGRLNAVVQAPEA